MSDQEQTYDRDRARALEALLVSMAERIQALRADGTLLQHAGELNRLLGDARSELFHYMVRVTYDTPEVAESRRIVREAREAQDSDNTWHTTEWTPDEGQGPA